MSDDKRITDNDHQREIDKLIADEPDPKVRLQLMVMNRINLSLLANTAETIHLGSEVSKISSKLETHVDNFQKYTKTSDELKNKGIGGFKVIVWGLGVIQILAVGFITNNKIEQQATKAEIAANTASITLLRNEEYRRAPYIKMMEDYFVKNLDKK